MSGHRDLERVGKNIKTDIIDFANGRLAANDGGRFHMDDLNNYVDQFGEWIRRLAPDSPGRILRDLRRRGIVMYDLLNRRKSLYQITAVNDNEQKVFRAEEMRNAA